MNAVRDLYLAQAFEHGEPERHSYVVAVGSLESVQRLARSEHARRHGEYGIAIYEVEPDVPMQQHPLLVDYLGSVMGERWVAQATAQAASAA
ncbi:MAG: hypothetical protein KGM87_16040 [Betaproteobacteria bacterium]|nr:hypothetical protein [Betaproteobacteria bacterium]MDE2480402.1 hypothetical protein [Betaproteobacteria bacterium]